MMLDQLLDEIRNLADEAKNHFDIEDNYYMRIDPRTVEAIEEFAKVKNNKKLDPQIRLMAYYCGFSIKAIRKNQVASLLTFNMLARLAFLIAQYTTEITNELSLLKQEKIKPVAEEKVREIETKLTELNQEFKKYSPTLRKFKKALDQTERTLRKNR